MPHKRIGYGAVAYGLAVDVANVYPTTRAVIDGLNKAGGTGAAVSSLVLDPVFGLVVMVAGLVLLWAAKKGKGNGGGGGNGVKQEHKGHGHNLNIGGDVHGPINIGNRSESEEPPRSLQDDLDVEVINEFTSAHMLHIDEVTGEGLFLIFPNVTFTNRSKKPMGLTVGLRIPLKPGNPFNQPLIPFVRTDTRDLVMELVNHRFHHRGLQQLKPPLQLPAHTPLAGVLVCCIRKSEMDVLGGTLDQWTGPEWMLHVKDSVTAREADFPVDKYLVGNETEPTPLQPKQNHDQRVTVAWTSDNCTAIRLRNGSTKQIDDPRLVIRSMERLYEGEWIVSEDVLTNSLPALAPPLGAKATSLPADSQTEFRFVHTTGPIVVLGVRSKATGQPIQLRRHGEWRVGVCAKWKNHQGTECERVETLGLIWAKGGAPKPTQ